MDVELYVGRAIGLAFVAAGLALATIGMGALGVLALGSGRSLATGGLFIAVGVGQFLKPDLLWSTEAEQKPWLRLGAALAVAAGLAWWLFLV